jgi:HAD superfamily hydrolase (TIGR01549 family)
MKAVIFDCDGTLVDSEPLAKAAWGRVLPRYGLEPTRDDWEAMFGRPYDAIYPYLAERASLPPPDALWDEFVEVLFASIDIDLVTFDDAAEAVRELHRRGIPLGVASSSPRDRLDRTLQRCGLVDYFDVTVAGDEIDNGKPAPDMFLEAARRLGVDPLECVVVEDSPTGVAAAVAANMTVVGVLRGDVLTLGDAHSVVERLDAATILPEVHQ